jgi:hypothetical protein
MRSFFKGLTWVDFLDVAIYAIPMGLLMIAGPLLVAYKFLTTGRYLPAGVLIALWLACAATCVRDIRRRHFSWVSGGLCATWLVLTLVFALLADG